ncbi:MAG: hypothetical protein H7A24_01145 [Leptospiraceae bacterium]|nr:FxLYD domain-containing protein [Leptospiraceae bacterium]MCP5510458.1 hypothetical protein [Leptospiraceae bacterium]
MKELICEKCGGNLSLHTQNSNFFKCDYCGTSYIMESSGNIRKKFVMSEFIKFDKKAILLIFIILMVLFGLYFIPVSEEKQNNSNSKPSSRTTKIEKVISESSEKHETGDTGGEISESEDEEEGISGIFEFSSQRKSSNYTYYYGFYKNTGTVDLDKPSIQINFYDEKGGIVDTVNGYGFKSILRPGEKTSILALASDGKKFSRYEILTSPKKPFYYPESVKIKLHSTRLTREANKSYEIIGIAENIDTKPAKFVHINGILFSEDKKILSISSTFTSQKILKPKDQSVFKLTFYGVEESKSYELEVDSRLAE